MRKISGIIQRYQAHSHPQFLGNKVRTFSFLMGRQLLTLVLPYAYRK